MSGQRRVLDDDTLQAWVDGRLDPARQAKIEARIEQDPALAARAAAYRRHRRALHQAFDGVLAEPIPDRLRVAPPRPRRRAALAAGVASFGLGIALGWFLALGSGPVPLATAAPRLPQEAALAYAVYAPEARHPVMVGAAEKAELMHWLSRRLGHTLQAPDLSAYGYHLMGGSLLPGSAGPAAQFMYQNAARRRITVYITWPRRPVQRTAFRFVRRDGVEVFYWIDGGMAYAVAGRLDRAALLRIAESVYRQLRG